MSRNRSVALRVAILLAVVPMTLAVYSLPLRAWQGTGPAEPPLLPTPAARPSPPPAAGLPPPRVASSPELPGSVSSGLEPVTAAPGPAPQDDPEKTASAFVDKTRQEASAAVASLRKEADALRERLRKVESALQRWETLLAAIGAKDKAAKPPPAHAQSAPLEPDPADSPLKPGEPAPVALSRKDLALPPSLSPVAPREPVPSSEKVQKK